MKKIRNAFLAMVIVGIAALWSCDKMDATHKAYLPAEERVYVGKSNYLGKYPGRNRIRFALQKPTDPKAVSIKLLWNGGAGEQLVSVPAAGKDTIFVLLNDLPEATYSFDIYAYDQEGRASVKTVVSASVYGEQYESSLLNRSLKRLFEHEGVPTIEWYGVDSTVVATELTYVDGTEVQQRLDVAPDEAMTALPDIKRGTAITYRTKYKPEATALDTFYTTYASRRVD